MESGRMKLIKIREAKQQKRQARELKVEVA
jgi:hypothetical protein